MGAAIPTVTMSVDFHAPSRHGDVLDFRLQPTRIGRSSLDLDIKVQCGPEKRLSLTSTLVFTDKSADGARSWPQRIRDRIATELIEPVKDDIAGYSA
jgi:4-hydroxybenzoyl-CoA thioesterase